MKNSKDFVKKLTKKRYRLFSLRNNHEKCVLKVWSLLFQKYLSRIHLRERKREWMEIENYEKKKKTCNNIRNIVL